MILPDQLIRHVNSAARGEARLAANRISGSDAQNPTLIVLCNTLAATTILEGLLHAAKTAETPEQKEVWRGVGLQLASAIQGELTS